MQFLEFMRGQPVFTLFFVLGLGYIFGNLRIGAFSLGPVAGVLFVGLFFGHFGFSMSAGAQAVGFAMFIFSVGYQAGPRFFDVLMTSGLKYLSLAAVVAFTGVLVAVVLAQYFEFAPGTSAGLLAGGLTSSPTLAAAQESVRDGTILAPQGWTADELIGNITTGYAITYIFGLAGLILIIKLLPGILRIDLVAEAKRLESETRESGAHATQDITFRVYRVTNEAITKKQGSEFKKDWDGFTWIRVRRNNEFIRIYPDKHLQIGDEIFALGPTTFVTRMLSDIGEEITHEHRASDYLENAQIIVFSPNAVGKTLEELDIARSYGVYISDLKRMRYSIPRTVDVKLRKGDVLTVHGLHSNIDAAAQTLGQVERDSIQTDLLTFSLGIAVGVLLGLLSVTVAGVPIGLGSAGGLLAAGLIIGFARSIRPTFGRLPDAARWILMELGLLIFMTGVGLRAGSDIVEKFSETGLQLVVAGVLVTCVPVFVGYFFGRKFLKLNPVILLGAITGSMTSGASLSIVTNAAKSEVPALGYTGAYAFANVLLTIAGTIILLLA
jgi:putative transport protein